MSAPPSSSPPDSPTGRLEEIARRLAGVEERLAALEQRLAAGGLAPGPEFPPPAPAPALAASAAPNPLPIIGRSLLGLAGAYVLRALTDSGVLPPAAGVATGLLYAFAWLLAVGRIPVERRLSAVLAAATSMAIMAPLLWEASDRLHVVPPWTAAAVLVSFVLASLQLSRFRLRPPVTAIVAAVSALLSLALLLGTRNIAPFTFALLTIAAAVEFSECSSRPTRARLLTAVLAATTVLLFARLIGRPGGLPEGYAPTAPSALLAAQILLLVIYLASAVAQSVFRRRALSPIEMFNAALALPVAFGGIVWVFHDNSVLIRAAGAAALLAGLVFYAISFLLFDQENKTNFRLWSSFGLVLVLAGAFLPLSAALVWIPWCLCALVCCGVALARRLPTLGLHGALYLLLSAAASGAAARSFLELFDPSPAAFPWPAAFTLLAASALCWAAIALSPAPSTAAWRNAAASLAIAAAFSVLLAASAFRILASAWSAIAALPAATAATAVLTSLSVALAYLSARWRRRELAWLAYAVMALGAYKLIARDFPRERNLTLVISLLFYGGALILLPRILQRSRPSPA